MGFKAGFNLRKENQFSFRLQLALMLTIPLVSSPTTLAESAWEFINQNSHQSILESIKAPSSASSAMPVEISLGNIKSLNLNDEIELKTSPSASVFFNIAGFLTFPNGDTSWYAAHDEDGLLETLSMTAGQKYFIASLVVQDNSFKIIAKKQVNEENYIGYIYSENSPIRRPINDTILERDSDSEAVNTRSFSALEEPAFDLQILDGTANRFFFIGDGVSWSFTITNPFAETTNPLSLSIGGKYVASSFESLNNQKVLTDSSDWIALPANCYKKNYEESNPYRKLGEIECRIEPIAPKSKRTLTLYSKLRADFSVNDLAFGGALPYPYSSVTEDKTYRAGYSEYARSIRGPLPVEDVLTDSDGDGMSDFNETLITRDPAKKDRVPARDVEIDVVVLYTSNFVEDISIDAETQINNSFTIVNEMFMGSETGIRFKIVHYEQLDYVNNCTAERCTDGQRWNDTQTVIAEYGKRGENQWQFSEKLRALYGADFVFILDGKAGDDPTAGQAESGVNNRGYFGLQKHKRTAFVHYNDYGFNSDELTMSHELGHLFGLGHSRRQARLLSSEWANESGTFPWAQGYGADNKFVTIMPYANFFEDAWQISRFSDASRSDCEYTQLEPFKIIIGNACGIDRSDRVDGADAVGAMKIVRYQIEQFSPSRPVLSSKSSDENDYDSRFLAGSINGIELGFKTKFLPSDSINSAATIQIDPAHVGKTGVTHIIIVAGALGALQMDSSGKFVNLDLGQPNLVGSIKSRPLKAIENLSALNELIPSLLGVSSAKLEIYFGYTLEDSGLTVYSETPLTVQISE